MSQAGGEWATLDEYLSTWSYTEVNTSHGAT